MTSYLFGGGATDAVVLDTLTTMSQDNRQHLITGWWRPTTLTAGRYLVSTGAVDCGAYVHTTTDELVLRVNRTTDSEFTTTGVDLVADEWRFLAFLSAHENTGALDAWRVWAGGVAAPPVACTVTPSVSGSGNSTGGSTLTLGNNNAGSVAFQGQIADVRYLVTSAPTGNSAHIFLTQTSGAIANVEADYVFERFVLPAWEGRSWERHTGRHLVVQFGWWPGFENSPWWRTGTAQVVDPTAVPTFTGVTVSPEGPPRRTMQHPFRPDGLALLAA